LKHYREETDLTNHYLAGLLLLVRKLLSFWQEYDQIFEEMIGPIFQKKKRTV